MLLDEKDKLSYLNRILNPSLTYLNRKALRKNILTKCKKISLCPYCGDINGTVKKGGFLKIVHEKYKNRKSEDAIIKEKLSQYDYAIQNNKELEEVLSQNRLAKILNPLEVIFNLKIVKSNF